MPSEKLTVYYAPYRLTNAHHMDEETRTMYGGEWPVYAKDAVDRVIAENEKLRKENEELRRIMHLATK